MAAIFQIRRGSGSINTSISDGELYLHKSSGSLQFSLGDGNPVTLARLDQPNSGSLRLGGDITASNAYFSGDVAISGNLFLGNNSSDNISALGVFTSNLSAGTTNTYDIGSTTSVWRNVYATSISGAIAATNGVISGSSQLISILDPLNAFSSSQLTQNTALATISGSLILTASANTISITNLNAFSSSQLTQNTALATITGSLILTASANTISIAELNGYSSSLKDAITVSGSGVSSTTTIKGNLVVQGTQTTIDSTTLNIGDNIIELNFGGSQTTAGIYAKDATGGSTTSGSLLWDSTLDYWKGGTLGNESKLLRAGGDNVISSSTQLGDLNAFTASINSRLNNLELTTSSLNISVSNINTTTASLNTSVSNINTFTASALVRFTNLESKSASVDISITNINTTTGSLNTSITNINSFTSSQLIQNTTLGNYTASVNQTTASLNIATASLNTWTGSTFTAYSNSVEFRLDDLEYTASISIGGGLAAQLTIINQHTASINTFSSSANSRLNNLEAATSSYETNGRGIVSGSSQIVPLLPTGVVSGSSQIVPLLPTGVVSGSIQILGGSTIHSGSSGDYQFNSIGVGTAASTVAGEIRATADITAFYSSDIRLKENIHPILHALEKVKSISGNTYNWKAGFDEIHSHKGNDIGVIAQEIEAVLPQIVTNRDNGYKAVQYEKIIPLLVEAIKELSAKIDRLENK
jgi:hypothetical protein